MRRLSVLTLVVVLSMAGTAIGGPFILDHTDADDHGSFNGVNNQDGWLYMQRVLENLAPGVTNGSMQVVQLGGSSSALTAATSAFNGSSLFGTWTFHSIDGDTALTDFFAGTSAVNVNTAGIIMLDSGSSHVGGGISASEGGIVNANATAIDSFLGGGGALHSMANRHNGAGGTYGYLSTLIPGITFNTNQQSGLQLTAAGAAAFPGLTNADLSAGPYHGQWTGGLGGLTVLFTSTTAVPIPVGIGSSGGSITNPNVVPEPGTIILFGMGVLGAAGVLRRRRRSA